MKDNIEYWFSTESGAHIPVRKGQTKEEALNAFLQNKGDSRGYSINELKKQQAKKIYNSDGGGHKVSTSTYQPDNYIEAVNNRLKTEQKPDLRQRYQEYINDVKNEPQISKDLKEITKEIGSDLLGYDFRLKNATGDRFYQKIAEEPTRRNKDNVRYTVKLGDSVAEYHKTAAELVRKGYKPLAVKNYWLSGGHYKGINTQWESPSGTQFEIQFHSEHNLAVKEELHPLYEHERDPNASKEERLLARKKQAEISAKFKPPKGIEEVR